MTRSGVILVGLICLAICSCSPDIEVRSTGELINGECELVGANAGWQFSQSLTTNASALAHGEGIDGSGAIRLIVGPRHQFASASQVISVTPGSKLRLSGSLRGEGSNVVAFMAMEFRSMRDPDNNRSSVNGAAHSQYLTNRFEWETVGISAEVPSGATRVWVFVNAVGTNGEVFGDNILLSRH